MQQNHTLGRVTVRAGEIITFTFDESTPERQRHLTVVAIQDLDLSREMALFCEATNRSGRDIYTENALPALIEHLAKKGLLHVGREVTVHVGNRFRPAARLMNEYKFRLNPESFWEDKLVNRYTTGTFNVFNHQGHSLTLMMEVDSPFTAHASIVDMQGEYLGHLRLSVLPDQPHTLISDDDIERIRLALQADITMNVEEISVMVERVEMTSNPDFGQNAFKRHISLPQPISNESLSRCTE